MKNEIKDGGSAFPRDAIEGIGRELIPSKGMSLRDYFAGQALCGAIANPTHIPGTIKTSLLYEVAEKMLKARDENV